MYTITKDVLKDAAAGEIASCKASTDKVEEYITDTDKGATYYNRDLGSKNWTKMTVSDAKTCDDQACFKALL